MRNHPQAPPGWFRQLGSIHLHIDANEAPDLNRLLVGDFEKAGIAVKCTYIDSSIAGPQLYEYSDLYHLHTAHRDTNQKMKSFFTIRLAKIDDVFEALRLILPALPNAPGVVEVERVIALKNERGQWLELPESEINSIDSAIEFEEPYTLPGEIHYAFNIPKRARAKQWSLPISLEKLLEDCAARGIHVGEWLLFDKANVWAYRSNMFADGTISLDLAKEQHSKLTSYLNSYSFDYSTWATVEQLLGVWSVGKTVSVMHGKRRL